MTAPFWGVMQVAKYGYIPWVFMAISKESYACSIPSTIPTDLPKPMRKIRKDTVIWLAMRIFTCFCIGEPTAKKRNKIQYKRWMQHTRTPGNVFALWHPTLLFVRE